MSYGKKVGKFKPKFLLCKGAGRQEKINLKKKKKSLFLNP
jgi:hypothetical protein